MNNKIKILAIETSCDETAAAIVELFPERSAGKAESRRADTKSMIVRPLSSVVFSQIDIHKKFGGVFPELASRAHSQKIMPVVTEALASAQVTSYKLLVTSKKSPVTNHQPRVDERLRVEAGQSPITSFYRRPSAMSVPSASIRDIDAIAVTTGPGLIGSLIVGVEFARGLAAALDKPVIPINHLEGHIYANFVGASTKHQETSSKQISKFEIQNSKLPSFPLLALIVSGGHTLLVLMRSHLDYEIIGTTLDDAAGEAFDKIARMLGLPYPGGPALSRLAESGDAKAFNFPRSMIDSGDFDFSFSGLKTSVFYKLRDLGLVDDKAEPIAAFHTAAGSQKSAASRSPLPTTDHDLQAGIAASAQQAIVDVLVKKTFTAAAKYKVKSILVGGGVSANKLLRDTFQSSVIANDPDDNQEARQSHPKIFLSPLDLTGDNALSIAIAACYRYKNGDTCSWQNLEANASLKLTNNP